MAGDSAQASEVLADKPGLLKTWWTIVRAPTAFFADPASAFSAFGFAIAMLLIGGTAGFASNAFFEGTAIGTAILGGLLHGAFAAFLLLPVLSALSFVGLRILRIRARFGAVFAVLAWSTAAVAANAVPVVGPIVAEVWRWTLTVLGLSTLLGVGRLRAIIGGVLLPTTLVVLPLIFVRTAGYEAFKIPSGSMQPTLLIDDHVFVSTSAYLTSDPERGDVIVFEAPRRDEIDTTTVLLASRILGVGGDTVSFRFGEAYVNGEPIRQCILGETTIAGDTAWLYLEALGRSSYLTMRQSYANDKQDSYTVPMGEVFVVGDNRTASYDSRAFNNAQGGTIPLARILGRVSSIYYPFARQTWNTRLLHPALDLSEETHEKLKECSQGLR